MTAFFICNGFNSSLVPNGVAFICCVPLCHEFHSYLCMKAEGRVEREDVSSPQASRCLFIRVHQSGNCLLFWKTGTEKESINAGSLNKKVLLLGRGVKKINPQQKQRGKSSGEVGVVKKPSPSNRLERSIADGFSVPVKCKSVESWHAVPWRAEVLTKDMQSWKMYICGKIHPDKWLHLSCQMDFTHGMKLNYCCTSNESIHGESTWPIKGNHSVIRSFKNYLALCHWVPAISDVCFPANLLSFSAHPVEVLGHSELFWSTNTSCTSHSKEFLKSFWGDVQHHGFFNCSLYLVNMKDAFVFGDIFMILPAGAI